LLKESLQGEYGWDGVTFVRESWLLNQNPALAELNRKQESFSGRQQEMLNRWKDYP
jgi:hypothetical protein